MPFDICKYYLRYIYIYIYIYKYGYVQKLNIKTLVWETGKAHFNYKYFS